MRARRRGPPWALSLLLPLAPMACALAQVAEALGAARQEVLTHWENCLRYADEGTPRGSELATMAQAQVREREGGR